MEPEEAFCADSLPNITSARVPNGQLSSSIGRGMRIQQQYAGLEQQTFGSGSLANSMIALKQGSDRQDRQTVEACEQSDATKYWDPRTILNNLSFLEKKIHQLQDLVHLIGGRRGYFTGSNDEILVQQQQLITADLTSVIVQLISTAGSLLPSVRHVICPEGSISQKGLLSDVVNDNVKKVEDQSDSKNFFRSEPQCQQVEDHEMKSDDDGDDGESLPPGSYEILQLEKEEILAPHTHFCAICGKGFKRDANLRMHMRGHGDEYKTPEALAKPNKELTSEPILIKRYSCPYTGCKRNKDHKKFQPLKTILCVKNHYKRTHCDKNYTCSRCNAKKFSVIADLKTHEKHCGRDKWICSCGTTFSRKDKLFGHIALFQGHIPAIPAEESRGQCSEATTKVEQLEFNFNMDHAEGCGDPTRLFSPSCFDTREFPRPQFDDCDSSFSFLLSEHCDYPSRNNSSME